MRGYQKDLNNTNRNFIEHEVNISLIAYISWRPDLSGILIHAAGCIQVDNNKPIMFRAMLLFEL